MFSRIKKYQFQVIAKKFGKTQIFPLKNEKELKVWMQESIRRGYEETQIYERDGLTYELRYSNNKRKIGF